VLRIESDYDRGLLLLLGVAFQGVATGWGLVIHHHRQLVARAGAEARLLAEQAQHHAREAVAREMHDVLGHRLSLLSVYAGALEYRPGAAAGGGRGRVEGDPRQRPPGAAGPACGHRRSPRPGR
jgi:signal transduction histidine kinase